jgi:hypothetical protein
MSLKGEFQQLRPTDLLPMLLRQSGILQASDLEGLGELELWIQEGRLQGLWHRGQPVPLDKAKELMRRFLLVQEGHFAFHPQATPRRGTYLLDWPLTQVLLFGLRATEEVVARRSRLPDPNLVFILTRHPQAVELPLFEQAKPLLQRGASARVLSEALQIPLEEARYVLHKLLTAGVIQPKPPKRPFWRLQR